MTSKSHRQSTKRRTVALLTSNASLGESYQGTLRWGVEQACSRHNADLLVYVGRTNWSLTGDQHKIYYFVDPDRIDAIIFATGVIASYAPLDEVINTIMERCPVPMCSIGQYCPGVPNVLVNNKAGTGQLVNHLVQHHGHRHFACIAGPEGHFESDERLIGTQESLRQHHLELPPEAVIRGDFSVSAGSEAVFQLLDQGTKMDVIVCANDYMAVGALDAVKAAGLSCPEDIVITGFDDTSSARFSSPPLTTVRQPVNQLGSIAVDYVIQVLDGDTPIDNPITLPTEAVIRESCGCQPGDILSVPLNAPNDQAPVDPPTIEINRLLSSQYEDDDQRNHWTQKLIASVFDEIEGQKGAFPKTLDAMLTALPFPHLPSHEFQRIITLLSQWADSLSKSTMVDHAFQKARVLVGSHIYRKAGERQLRNDALVDELRVSWERLTTALSLSVLRTNLLLELPRLGIQNGIISLFESASHKSLIPWLCLRDGEPVDLPITSYPSNLLIPDEVQKMPERQSLTVLPITFETEMFGIAVLELPFGLDAYALLREQIGSALRAVKEHEDFLAKERLQLRIEEEHRLVNERLHSLRIIAGGVAHDLNNVLGPIVALPDTIELDLRDITAVPEAVFDDIELIRQASQRAAHTIGDLFLLGSTQETPRTYLSLNHLLEKEAASFCTPHGRKDVDVQVNIEDVDLVIQGSKSHIVRAVTNLVINAAKAIRGTGKIQVVARRVQLAETLTGDTPIPRGTYAVVEVRDNGCGISEELLPKIMEPFFTVSHTSQKPGTGLGLAIVRRIVKESQGYIHVNSTPGKGSTFSLYFPLADRRVTPSKPPAQVSGGSESLLVVDDEMVQLRAAQRILKHLGYDVTTVQSGEAAIGLFEDGKNLERFDLLIVDMLMPGLDGIETVERIRQYRPSQKAIIASGYAPERMSVAAAKRGMAWLAKPYTVPVLANAVREILTKNSH